MKAYNPYNRGRWYRFFIESDGTTQTLTQKDLPASIASNRLKLPVGFNIVDAKYDFSNELGSSQTFNHSTYYATDGTQGVSVPNANVFDYGYIYIFGYYR